jgi:alpha-beta hydrolase superfamily lysophospholipase
VEAEHRANRTRFGLRFSFLPRGYSMFLVYLLLGYGVLVLLVYLAQYQLLYLPVTSTAERVTLSARALGLKLWPREGGEYRGLIAAKRSNAARGTVLVWHGNAGSAEDRKYYVDALEKLGYRVILLEYPGYGARRGKLGETSFVADARESVEIALMEFGRPIYMWGESLGCGIATGVTVNSATAVDGVILLTPWDTLANTAQAHYWYLPARWLTRDKYDNIKNLEGFTGPVAVVMADQDEVIPQRLTTKLYDSLTTTKHLWVFPRAGHNSWPVAPELAWWGEVMQFVADKGGSR